MTTLPFILSSPQQSSCCCHCAAPSLCLLLLLARWARINCHLQAEQIKARLAKAARQGRVVWLLWRRWQLAVFSAVLSFTGIHTLAAQRPPRLRERRLKERLRLLHSDSLLDVRCFEKLLRPQPQPRERE